MYALVLAGLTAPVRKADNQRCKRNTRGRFGFDIGIKVFWCMP